MRAFCAFATLVALLPWLASPAFSQTVIDVPLAANDIVYDAVGGKLFASVTGSGVAVINPSNGAIERFIAVGSGPNQLAVSDDGQFLYVGLDGEHAVRRVTLASFTPDLLFSLGANTAEDIIVMPGAPHTTAVWRFGESNDVAIYDDDVRRISTLPTGFAGTLLPGSGQRLYGWTFVSFVRMTVTASGVVADGETSGFNRESQVSATDGLLYFAGGTSEPTRGGSVVDPESFKVLGTVMPAWNEYIGFLVKDPTVDRIYAFGPTIQAYDANTFTRQWSALTIDFGDYGYPTSVASTGRGRLAFASREKVTLASFANTELLNLGFSGNGNGRVSIVGAAHYCELACASPISSGQVVGLTAIAEDGSTFVGWHGDPDCADGFVTMSTARSCVAEFTQPGGLGNRLHIPATDIAYSAATDRFYASVPGWAGPGGNSIAVVNPTTAMVEQSVWVGGEPGKLALSNDGRRLYVGLNGVGQVRRVDLQPLTPQPAFSVSGCEGPCTLAALAVSPIDADSVAIAVTSQGIWPNTLGAIYSGGVRRPSAVDSWTTTVDLAFSDTGDRLFRYDSAHQLQRLAVGGGGLSVVDSVPIDLGWGGISVRANRIYGASGRTLDADSLELVGTFSSGAEVRPALVDDTAWLGGFGAGARLINAVDTAHFSLRHSMVATTCSPSAAVLTLAAGREHVAYGDGRFLYLVRLSGSPALTIGKSGTGNGRIASQPAGIDCGDWCSNLFRADATVTLTVYPNSGTRFAGWTGDADCNDGVVTMSTARTCTAVFVQMTSGQGLQLPLKVNDLAYSASTGLLYASVPGTNAIVGNSVIALDPTTGAMSGSVWVGSEPNQLAMSSDGAVLYVGLDGAAAVRRVNLTAASMSPGPDFRLGTGPRRAAELAVVPGDPDSVVVSEPGLTLFSGGVARPKVAPPADSITFSDLPTSMFSSGNGNVVRIEVGPDGLTTDANPLITFPYATGRIRFDSGRIYDDLGHVMDSLTGMLVATLPSVGSWSAVVAPDVAHGIVYFVTADPAVLRFDAQTLALIDARPQAGPPSRPKRVVVAGVGRLGYVDGDGQPVLYSAATPVSYQLFLDSTFAPSVTLAVSPADTLGQTSGITPLTRNYAPGTSVTITAPATVGDKTFDQWLDGRGFYVSQDQTLVVSMTSPKTYAAAYHGPQPTVTSVEPVFGSATGGTPIVIRGTGFEPGARVDIGYSDARSVAVIDSTTITCVTPARFPDTVWVGVVNPDHQGGALSLAFTYYGAPTISGVAPPSAPPAGGTQLTVSGSQFVPGHTSLKIAGQEALDVTVGFGSGSSGLVLTALSPPGPAGPAVVSVTTPFGTASVSGAFRYTESPGALTFTDDPLTPQSTRIRVVHITELRAAIDTLRSGYGLSAFAWTDPTVTAGVTVVKASHVAELRTALAAVYTAALRAQPTYTHGTIAGGVTVITTTDIAELREAVRTVW
jgi:sugar lactone lactonase YvrE